MIHLMLPRQEILLMYHVKMNILITRIIRELAPKIGLHVVIEMFVTDAQSFSQLDIFAYSRPLPYT